MSEKIESLSATEYDTVGKALWELIKQYPRQPDDLVPQYDELGADESLAVLTLSGGGYKSRNIQGGFTATMNFRVAYKSMPSDSPQRIDSQAFVGKIMAWLENVKELPLLTDNRTITKITASNVIPYRDETGNDNSIVYAADAVMEYEAD
jgi:hypothetical protein